MKRYFNPIVKTFTVLTVLLLFSSASGANDAQLTFVIYDFYPFGKMENGKIIGLFPDLIAEVEKISGIKVVLAIEPIPRALKSIAHGEHDFILSGATSPAFKNTRSLGTVGCNRAIVVTAKKAKLSTLVDLHGRRIGFISNGFLLRKFGNKFGLVAVQTSSGESLFRMLIRNRIDGIFISDIVFDSYRKEGAPFVNFPKDWIQQIGPNIEAEKLVIHLRMINKSKHDNAATKIVNAIKIGNKIGAFEAVYRKYGSINGGRC